jgi:hypothetical protein
MSLDSPDKRNQFSLGLSKMTLMRVNKRRIPRMKKLRNNQKSIMVERKRRRRNLKRRGMLMIEMWRRIRCRRRTKRMTRT